MSEGCSDLESNLRRWTRVRESFFGTFAFVRGLAYIPNNADLPHAVRIISHVVPIQAWAWAWILAGVCMYVSAFRYFRWATYPVIGLCLFWMVGYLWSAGLDLGDPNPLLAAFTFFLLAGVILAGTVIVSIALKLASIVYPAGEYGGRRSGRGS